jgi:hypothetical protein
MTLSKTALFLLLGGGLSYASSLSVYQDSSFYNFTPENNFIGFAQNIHVKCKGNTIPVSAMTACPPEDRLCKLLNHVERLEEKEMGIQANLKVLGQLISLPQPTTFDAVAWIDAARLTGEEQARLSRKATKLKNEINIQQNNFRKQAPRRMALQTLQTCPSEVEITIPYGIHFSTLYEANIVDNKEIEVTQYLSIVNSSGIDIEVDSANFYYRMANQYVNPIHFNPWIVSKYVPKPKRMYKKSMMKNARVDMAMMAEESMMLDGAGAPPLAPVASYEDAREYKITNLTLPSSGVPLEVKLLSWKTALECEVRAYPYASTRAFHVCSFSPKFQIDSNKWKIKSSDIVINENAVGEYRDNSYNLYTKVEEDIQIQRRPIVKRERETGIFGGTARKKDGFKLILTNKSDKEKILTLVERIPTSTTEEIKSKLLSVKSAKKVNYKVLKNGQIEMKIALAAHENKEIEILFEISYDKDLKVNY